MKSRPSVAFLLRCALFAPLLFGDPALQYILRLDVFQPSWDRMAAHLRSGEPVATYSDLRALKAAYLRRLPPETTWLVFGSSRALTITSEWFSKRTVWNAAVPRGGIDDAAAFLEICRESGRLPKGIILELSPVLVHALNPGELLELREYRNRAILRYGVDPRPAGLDQEDFYWLGAAEDFRLMFHSISSSPTDRLRIMPSGDMIFPVPEQPLTASSSLAYARRDAGTERMRSEPEAYALQFLRRLLDDLQLRGVRVVAFLAPVNPWAWDYYRAHGAYDESIIRRELSERNIQVVGSYSPHVTHATPNDFFDNVHPRPVLVRRLFEEAGLLDESGTNTLNINSSLRNTNKSD